MFRIIARCDIKGKNLIKGIRYEGVRVIGDPGEFASNYYTDGADEIVYIDAVASLYERSSLAPLVENSIEDISENHEQFNESRRPFANAGLIIGRQVFTSKGEAYFDGKHTVLNDIVEKDESKIPNEFYIDKSSLKKWKKAKDAKSIPRVSKDGHKYNYSEGKMSFPDKLDKPSRTIVTAEGGTSVSRFKHVIQTESGRYRRLMPLELERLNMFDDNWTAGPPDTKRAFFMGNALVVGIVEKLSNSLLKQINE